MANAAAPIPLPPAPARGNPLRMADAAETYDRRGLITESYRIEGIGAADCRSIFLDWALGLPAGVAPAEAAAALLAHHRPPEDHPMTALLRDAAEGPAGTGRRRGGARGRDGLR